MWILQWKCCPGLFLGISLIFQWQRLQGSIEFFFEKKNAMVFSNFGYWLNGVGNWASPYLTSLFVKSCCLFRKMKQLNVAGVRFFQTIQLKTEIEPFFWNVQLWLCVIFLLQFTLKRFTPRHSNRIVLVSVGNRYMKNRTQDFAFQKLSCRKLIEKLSLLLFLISIITMSLRYVLRPKDSMQTVYSKIPTSLKPCLKLLAMFWRQTKKN